MDAAEMDGGGGGWKKSDGIAGRLQEEVASSQAAVLGAAALEAAVVEAPAVGAAEVGAVEARDVEAVAMDAEVEAMLRPGLQPAGGPVPALKRARASS